MESTPVAFLPEKGYSYWGKRGDRERKSIVLLSRWLNSTSKATPQHPHPLTFWSFRAIGLGEKDSPQIQEEFN